MKSAPQMLRLLREIDDLVSFAAGSSCSVSQELWLDWCQCQSGFHSPSSASETNPLGLLLCCPRTINFGATRRRDLAQGWASSRWGHLEPLIPKVPIPIPRPWLGDKAPLPWSDVLDAMPQTQDLRKTHPQPWHHHLMSHSQIWNSTLVAVPQTQVYFLSSWATGFPLRQIPWFLQGIFLTNCEGFHQL